MLVVLQTSVCGLACRLGDVACRLDLRVGRVPPPPAGVTDPFGGCRLVVGGGRLEVGGWWLYGVATCESRALYHLRLQIRKSDCPRRPFPLSHALLPTNARAPNEAAALRGRVRLLRPKSWFAEHGMSLTRAQ